jgi:pimeloyl-ACP methyl ester carboxylesterase
VPILKLDDADLTYETHGEGRPFLFCSATATGGAVWRLCQVGEFARDHRVIIYDQRGVGRSGARSNDFSTRRLAADAAALLDHLAARDAIVCGHSNGGRIAQLLALDYPGRVGKLILASSGGTHHSQGIPLAMCLELVEKGYARMLREHAIEAGFTKAYVATHPAEIERFLKVRLADPPPLEIFLRHVIGRQEFDSGDRVKHIAVPTLVMVGDDEGHGRPGARTHLDFAKSLAADIPGARLVVLEGQGHYYYFSAAEQTNRIIREFIAG